MFRGTDAYIFTSAYPGKSWASCDTAVEWCENKLKSKDPRFAPQLAPGNLKRDI
jgi:hypothetical protein